MGLRPFRFVAFKERVRAMRKTAEIFALLLLMGATAMAATSPDRSAVDSVYLVRVERQTQADLSSLLDAGIPVVMEMQDCLLVTGGAEEIIALEKLGYRSAILDTGLSGWDYYSVGLRPDSEMKPLLAIGTVLHTEENWIILKVPPNTDISSLLAARVFISKISLEEVLRPAASPSMADAYLRPPGPEGAVPLVQQMVNSVNTADIDSFWTALVANAPTGTRYSPSTGCSDAANYVLGQFQNFGLEAQNITYDAGHAPNTEGEIIGAVTPDVIYIIEGSIDDLPSTGLAPGADDNASACVVVLEAAKVLSCYAFKNTVRFLTVSGNEAGLLGSTAYANNSYSLGENIQGVLDFNMVGWAGDGTPATENLDLNYNSDSQALGTFYSQCAADYSTGLVVDAFLCPSFNVTDHYPFWAKGYKAISGLTDNAGYCSHDGLYPYYHTVDDTIANCGNKSFFYSVVKTSLAALAELGEPFKITLDKSVYGCTATVTVIIGDRDLNTSSSTVQTATILIWSTREGTPENLVLTEDGVNSMIFRGTMNLTTITPSNGDGFLSVNPGDIITARYIDPIDCNGASNVTYDTTASVDCTAPVITNVQASNVTGNSATITWTTDEAANGRVTYGQSTPPGTNKDDLTNFVTSHSMQITGLSECTSYHYSVTSADAVGNSSTSDNAGSYYAFETIMNTNPTYESTDVPKAIPDPGTATSAIVVSDTKTIQDVNVTIPSLTHAYDGDLEIRLRGPDNTLVLLVDNRGGAGDNFTNTAFDDEAATAITSGTPPYTGSFRPEGLLSSFDNKSANGTWTLEVTDNAANDAGTLYGWSLTFTYPYETCSCTPPGSPSLNSATGTCTAINLSWSAGSGTTFAYNIYRKEEACGGPYTKIAGPVTATTYSDTGAAAGTSYAYVIRGTCDLAGMYESLDSNCLTAGRLANPTPTISGPSSNICPATSVTLFTESGQSDYQWYRNGSTISGATTSSFVATLSGDFTVSYSNGSGCSATSAAKSVSILVCAPNIMYQSHVGPTAVDHDGDAEMEAGEKWRITVTVANTGNIAATGVLAYLSGEGLLHCINPGSFGDIAPGGTASYAFDFVVDPSYWYATYPCGSSIGFDLVNKSSDGGAFSFEDDINFASKSVGLPSSTAALFVDDFTDLSNWAQSPASSTTLQTTAGHCTGHSDTFARIRGASDATFTITYPVSTVGYESIHVIFDRVTSGMATNENLYLEWYDGAVWTQAYAGHPTTWECSQDIGPLPSGANNNAAFQIRFRNNASAVAETASVDRVIIRGASLANCSTWTASCPPCAMTVDTEPIGAGSACVGDSITFAVTASGGVAPITYQWTENGVDISGATSSIYTTSKPSAGSFTYNCKVSDSGGCSNITDPAPSSGAWTLPPSVDVTPNGTSTLCLGAQLVLTAMTGGGTSPYSYQWTENGSDISWATNSTYTASKGAAGSHSYNCKVASAGCATEMQDPTASVGSWVNPPSPTISGPSEGCQSVPIETQAFSTYQWKLSGMDISGATNRTHQATEPGTYTILVTDANGCSSTSPPHFVMVHLNPSPLVYPTSQVACLSGSTYFTVSEGSAANYRWRKGGSDLSEGGHYSGVSAATLNIVGITASEAGIYDCVVTDADGCTGTSPGAQLSTQTCATPVITPEPPFTAGTANAITWSPVTDATAYEVQASDDNFESVYQTSGQIPGTSHTFTGLSSGTSYQYRAKAYFVAGSSDWSPYQSSIQDSAPPSSNIQSPSPGAVIFCDRATVSGTASDALSGIASVEVSLDGGSSWHQANGTTSWTYLWTLPPDGSYEIKSRAIDSVGNLGTEHGTTVQVRNIPAPATGVTASDIPYDDGMAIQIAWTKSSDDGAGLNYISGYEIWRSDAPSGTYTQRGFVVAGKTFYEDAVNPGETWYYKVKAKTACGVPLNYSDSSAAGPVTATDEVPLPVNNLQAELTLGCDVRLSWIESPSPDVLLYNIYCNGGTGQVNYATPIGTAYPPATTWTSSGLPLLNRYLFAVRAKDVAGQEDGLTTNEISIHVQCDSTQPSAIVFQPQANRIIGNDQVTVKAKLTMGSSANTKEVLFQYRATGQIPWNTISPCGLPNPTAESQYVTYWDTTLLTARPYDLRAVAYALDGTPDPYPQHITISVTNVTINMQVSETEESGDHIAQYETYRGSGNSNHTAFGRDENSMQVLIPKGSMPQFIGSLTLRDHDPAVFGGGGFKGVIERGDKPLTTIGDLNPANMYRSVSLGGDAGDFNSSLDLVIFFKDANRDGILDGTDIPVTQLDIFRHDAPSDTWILVNQNRNVDTSNNYIHVTVYQSGTYGLFSYPKPETVKNLKVEKSGGTDALLTWDPVTKDDKGNTITVDHYNIYASSTSSFNPDLIARTNRLDQANGTALTHSGALDDPGAKYYLVTAVDSLGRESYPR